MLQEGVNARDLLMRMMQVFVLKFKTVSKLQLPVLMARHKLPAATGNLTASTICMPNKVRFSNDQKVSGWFEHKIIELDIAIRY